eukprot:TRINITY_DN20920_c0_g1_i1.p1 TRINITY_DN20920_c0_g1~~TRINITY_DN20920_c0_g1_i1.p1  ORF type:complete len:279 (+),score=50.52 TRINITY_DN20920_c0_g1_i1:272-1108(+)
MVEAVAASCGDERLERCLAPQAVQVPARCSQHLSEAQKFIEPPQRPIRPIRSLGQELLRWFGSAESGLDVESDCEDGATPMSRRFREGLVVRTDDASTDVASIDVCSEAFGETGDTGSNGCGSERANLLFGDPWEGFEDLAEEGLVEWLADVNAAPQPGWIDAQLLGVSPAPSRLNLDGSRSAASWNPFSQRDEGLVSSVSTAATLSAVSVVGSGVSAFLPSLFGSRDTAAPDAALRRELQDPLYGARQRKLADPRANDWEAEFLMRGVLASAAAMQG